MPDAGDRFRVFQSEREARQRSMERSQRLRAEELANRQAPVSLDDLFDRIQNSPRADERAKLLAEAQRMLANEAVNGFLYQPQWVTVANKNVKGLWKDVPIFANDLSALSWGG